MLKKTLNNFVDQSIIQPVNQITKQWLNQSINQVAVKSNGQ